MIEENSSGIISSLRVTGCNSTYGWNRVNGYISKVSSYDHMSNQFEYQTDACGGTTYFNF
jgi:hypothetical protein